MKEDIDRQELAFGKAGHDRLAARSAAVVGVSGGGSHVGQQFIHAGIGCLFPVDDQFVEGTNLRRFVGAIAADVANKTKKIDVVRRLAESVRPSVEVRRIDARFPLPPSLEEVSKVDLIVGCLDDDASRDDLNRFAIERRIPYIDIGATIIPYNDDAGFRAFGQVMCVWPGGPCLRCMGLITDVSIEQAHHQRHYVEGEDEPQVVSINGTLASEAVTAGLLYLTLGLRPPTYRRYVLPPGTLSEMRLTVETACTYCGFSGRIGPRSLKDAA